MITTTIRCDEADKRAAAEIAEYYGFDLSSITRAFWKQIARTGRIPLDFGNEEPIYQSSPVSHKSDEVHKSEEANSSSDL